LSTDSINLMMPKKRKRIQMQIQIALGVPNLHFSPDRLKMAFIICNIFL
jgi:hypothetical protein